MDNKRDQQSLSRTYKINGEGKQIVAFRERGRGRGRGRGRERGWDGRRGREREEEGKGQEEREEVEEGEECGITNFGRLY